MASTDKKSASWARDLEVELRLRAARFATPLIVYASQDTSGNPLVIVSYANPLAIGAAGCTIRIAPKDWPLVQTSVGLPQPVYNPHVLEIVYENGVAGNTVEMRSIVESICRDRGIDMKIYESTNGTLPDYTQMVVANLKANIPASTVWGSIGSQ